eukprot:gnl/Chilomastix_cuspidata/3025.p1 GENE.gnl/Chilomastix_cuspidata/3025~~gnl/Chilomastix_cuspidata/3025.p1  ORF type:complete len:1377 (-),score=358.11 gnl/Chilomastix_cuspidata/3025:107-4237(-)
MYFCGARSEHFFEHRVLKFLFSSTTPELFGITDDGHIIYMNLLERRSSLGILKNFDTGKIVKVAASTRLTVVVALEKDRLLVYNTRALFESDGDAAAIACSVIPLAEEFEELHTTPHFLLLRAGPSLVLVPWTDLLTACRENLSASFFFQRARRASLPPGLSAFGTLPSLATYAPPASFFASRNSLRDVLWAVKDGHLLLGGFTSAFSPRSQAASAVDTSLIVELALMTPSETPLELKVASASLLNRFRLAFVRSFPVGAAVEAVSLDETAQMCALLARKPDAETHVLSIHRLPSGARLGHVELKQRPSLIEMRNFTLSVSLEGCCELYTPWGRRLQTLAPETAGIARFGLAGEPPFLVCTQRVAAATRLVVFPLGRLRILGAHGFALVAHSGALKYVNPLIPRPRIPAPSELLAHRSCVLYDFTPEFSASSEASAPLADFSASTNCEAFAFGSTAEVRSLCGTAAGLGVSAAVPCLHCAVGPGGVFAIGSAHSEPDETRVAVTAPDGPVGLGADERVTRRVLAYLQARVLEPPFEPLGAEALPFTPSDVLAGLWATGAALVRENMCLDAAAPPPRADPPPVPFLSSGGTYFSTGGTARIVMNCLRMPGSRVPAKCGELRFTASNKATKIVTQNGLKFFDAMERVFPHVTVGTTLDVTLLLASVNLLRESVLFHLFARTASQPDGRIVLPSVSALVTQCEGVLTAQVSRRLAGLVVADALHGPLPVALQPDTIRKWSYSLFCPFPRVHARESFARSVSTREAPRLNTVSFGLLVIVLYDPLTKSNICMLFFVRRRFARDPTAQLIAVFRLGNVRAPVRAVRWIPEVAFVEEPELLRAGVFMVHTRDGGVYLVDPLWASSRRIIRESFETVELAPSARVGEPALLIAAGVTGQIHSYLVDFPQRRTRVGEFPPRTYLESVSASELAPIASTALPTVNFHAVQFSRGALLTLSAPPSHASRVATFPTLKPLPSLHVPLLALAAEGMPDGARVAIRRYLTDIVEEGDERLPVTQSAFELAFSALLEKKLSDEMCLVREVAVECGFSQMFLALTQLALVRKQDPENYNDVFALFAAAGFHESPEELFRALVTERLHAFIPLSIPVLLGSAESAAGIPAALYTAVHAALSHILRTALRGQTLSFLSIDPLFRYISRIADGERMTERLDELVAGGLNPYAQTFAADFKRFVTEQCAGRDFLLPFAYLFVVPFVELLATWRRFAELLFLAYLDSFSYKYVVRAWKALGKEPVAYQPGSVAQLHALANGCMDVNDKPTPPLPPVATTAPAAPALKSHSAAPVPLFAATQLVGIPFTPPFEAQAAAFPDLEGLLKFGAAILPALGLAFRLIDEELDAAAIAQLAEQGAPPELVSELEGLAAMLRK